jgi:hypothetical protein
MHGVDLDRLEKLAEVLALAFSVVMFTALVMTLAGSTGSGFLLLILGSCAHVGRAALEEFVERERALGGRSKPGSGLRPARAAPPAPRPRRVARPVRAASGARDRVSVRSGG